MSGVSEGINKEKLKRVIVAVLKQEQVFARTRKIPEVQKVKTLKHLIRSEVLDIKNYGGGK